MTVMESRAARASASAVFPDAVGPTTTMVRGGSAPAKPPLQLVRRKLHDGGPAVHVVGRKRRGEETIDQLAHFVGIEAVSGLDRGPTRERGRETLQAILPPPEAAPG